MARLLIAFAGSLVLGGCSLLFDGTELTGGSAAPAGGPGGGPASSGATSSATTSAGGEGGAGGAVPSATTTAGPGGGGEGGGAAGGGAEPGAGGAGGAPCGPRFCETEAADAAYCFDFDGTDPFAGLELWHPDSATITAEVDAVTDPVLSCPRAASARIEEVGSDGRAFAFLGFDVPQASDAFVWAFAVLRVASESDATSNTIAQMSWSVGETPCQMLVQMRDTSSTEGRVSVYTQAHDGTSWQPVGSRSLLLPRATVGAWTNVEIDVDLARTGTVTLRADGLEGSTAIDAVCGAATTHYDLDLGHHFTNRVQSTVFDDLTVRWPGG